MNKSESKYFHAEALQVASDVQHAGNVIIRMLSTKKS